MESGRKGFNSNYWLSAVIIILFYVGFVYYYKWTNREEKKNDENKTNIAAFTITTKISEKMWRQSLQSYDGKQSKYNYFI